MKNRNISGMKMGGGVPTPPHVPARNRRQGPPLVLRDPSPPPWHGRGSYPSPFLVCGTAGKSGSAGEFRRMTLAANGIKEGSLPLHQGEEWVGVLCCRPGNGGEGGGSYEEWGGTPALLSTSSPRSITPGTKSGLYPHDLQATVLPRSSIGTPLNTTSPIPA